MRARAAAGGILASLGILVIGWQIGSAGTSTSTPTASSSVTTGTTGSATSGSGTSASTGSTSAGSTTTATAASSGATDGTYTGSVVNTRFGAVQVSVTISGGTVTDVTALKLTDADGRSVQISNRAAPVLRQEVLVAQSANVSNVSGATFTSDAYLTSLQSALDQAGF